MDRYRNNYNNSSEDDYAGGTWVYMNGELYHAGVKGMHWYQHLPGTDWWKLAKLSYKNYMNNPSNRTNTGNRVKDVDERGNVTFRNETKAPSKLQAGVHAIKTVATAAGRAYGKYFKNEASYYSQKLSEFAKQAYSSVREDVTNFFKKGGGLETYIDKKAYGMNAWLFNAERGITIGVNNFLEKIGMKKPTDNFMSKMSGTRISDLTKQSTNGRAISSEDQRNEQQRMRQKERQEEELKKKRRNNALNRAYYNRPNIVDPKWRQ